MAIGEVLGSTPSNLIFPVTKAPETELVPAAVEALPLLTDICALLMEYTPARTKTNNCRCMGQLL
jgi:hypothetical protein